ncbi:hypothetical protein M8J75_012424 [Diaphorina citri]|nr:hypothetical protein M8J75_012424 [Diaphorina citri]
MTFKSPLHFTIHLYFGPTRVENSLKYRPQWLRGLIEGLEKAGLHYVLFPWQHENLLLIKLAYYNRILCVCPLRNLRFNSCLGEDDRIRDRILGRTQKTIRVIEKATLAMRCESDDGENMPHELPETGQSPAQPQKFTKDMTVPQKLTEDMSVPQKLTEVMTVPQKFTVPMPLKLTENMTVRPHTY